MKIRNLFESEKKATPGIDMPSGGVEIISDDGRILFQVRQLDDGSIEVNATSWCHHGGRMLADEFVIKPITKSTVIVKRIEIAVQPPRSE